jgi:hypothetical protein
MINAMVLFDLHAQVQQEIFPFVRGEAIENRIPAAARTRQRMRIHARSVTAGRWCPSSRCSPKGGVHRGLKPTRDGYLAFNALVHNGRFPLAARKTARAKKSAKKATARRPKAPPKAGKAVKEAPGRAAKAITNTARKAVKDAPKVVITVARKTRAGARRAMAIGATLEKVGQVVAAGAAAVDTVASAMGKPAGTGRGRANATTKRRKRSA